MGNIGQKELDHIHWLTTALSLPEEGVARYFPDEPAMIKRLVDVRWPDGPRCVRCLEENLTRIETRSLFQCRKCRHQFSVTSGTALHRTRLPLGNWFQAAESLIHYHVDISLRYHMPGHALAQKLGIQYVAARRIRKVVLADIEEGGHNFLRSAVCVQALKIPTGVTAYSNDHLRWLVELRLSGLRFRS